MRMAPSAATLREARTREKGTVTNRIILHLAVAIALMPITSHAADSAKASEWRVGHQMDRMTEEPVWFASSKWIGPEEPTRPPFDNLRSTIGFECAAEGEWIGMAFSEVPRLRRTQAYLFEETRYVELRMGVPPKLIIFNGVLGGARAPHCQERRLQRDRFATTMTILNRSDCFGAARAGSEWPARHAHSSACPNA